MWRDSGDRRLGQKQAHSFMERKAGITCVSRDHYLTGAAMVRLRLLCVFLSYPLYDLRLSLQVGILD